MTTSINSHEVSVPCQLESAVEALNFAANTTPDKLALSYMDKTFTYAEVRALSHAAAKAFTDAGLTAGDRVIIQLQNVPQFLVAMLGAWSKGIITVAVSPMYKAREVHVLASDSGATAILTSPNLWERQGAAEVAASCIRTVFLTSMEDFAGEVPAWLEKNRESTASLPNVEGAETIDFTSLLREGLDGNTTVAPLELPDPAHPAILAYTSGTSGPPKGAIVTHSNLVAAGWNFSVFHELDSSNEVQLCIAPLVHITGIGVSMSSWLLTGSSMVLSYRFSPQSALEDIEKWGVTWMAGTTTAFIALTNEAETSTRDYSTLKRVTAGGAGMPAAMVQRFRNQFGFDILPGFGMTETSGSIASTPVPDGVRNNPDNGMASAGVPLPGTDISIQNADGDIVAIGEHGEICVRGKAVVDGYWQNEKATNATFKNGWLHSGDIGFMDEDGWIYVIDRIKNLIIASGYKVWPREVEEVIAHYEGIREVAVVGAPHDYRGETVVAFVATRDDALISESDIISHCRNDLANYKVPSSVIFMPELPKNNNGKILHRELADIARKGVAQPQS